MLPRKNLHLLSLVCRHGQTCENEFHTFLTVCFLMQVHRRLVTKECPPYNILLYYPVHSEVISHGWLLYIYIFRAVWSHIPLQQDLLLQQVLGLIPWSLLLLLICKLVIHWHLLPVSMVKPTRWTIVSNLFYFGITLRVSNGLSVYHQELTTVHTATGICLTYACCCMYSRELLMTDGKTVRNT